MTADTKTLAFYNGEAMAYADYTAGDRKGAWLARFAAQLHPGATVLDFGCGSGWAAHEFKKQGFQISALDGSTGLAEEARRRYGIEVRVARFEELGDVSIRDGIWASFCLLHDTRDAMPGHLARLHRALTPGGWLYLGLKEGEGECRDSLDRRYTYFGETEIGGLLREAGFSEMEIMSEQSIGYDGAKTAILHILAQRGTAT